MSKHITEEQRYAISTMLQIPMTKKAIAEAIGVDKSTVYRVDSLMKRWINGTHQGNVSPKYLQYYLDEYAFRFNRKLSTYRGKLFFRLMQQVVETPPTPLSEITKNKINFVLSR